MYSSHFSINEKIKQWEIKKKTQASVLREKGVRVRVRVRRFSLMKFEIIQK